MDLLSISYHKEVVFFNDVFEDTFSLSNQVTIDELEKKQVLKELLHEKYILNRLLILVLDEDYDIAESHTRLTLGCSVCYTVASIWGHYNQQEQVS